MAVVNVDSPSDGLAWPISFAARYGEGIDRALVLGGGGIVFIAWQLAYLRGLERGGVQLADADRVVGTSAGSVVATVLMSGHLTLAYLEIETLAKTPRLLSVLAPSGNLHPSQLRALQLFWSAVDSEPDTIRAIGHAALAAVTPDVDTLPRGLELVLAERLWPNSRLHVTAVDAYTGERLVITQATDEHVPLAAAASSSVPGLFAPQPIRDRRCMDGGVSGTGTHPDLVAGAKRALVIALRDNLDVGVGTVAPGSLARDLDSLRASGTQVELRVSGIPADVNLMDPLQVPNALKFGAAKAAADVPALAEFFNRPSDHN